MPAKVRGRFRRLQAPPSKFNVPNTFLRRNDPAFVSEESRGAQQRLERRRLKQLRGQNRPAEAGITAQVIDDGRPAIDPRLALAISELSDPDGGSYYPTAQWLTGVKQDNPDQRDAYSAEGRKQDMRGRDVQAERFFRLSENWHVSAGIQERLFGPALEMAGWEKASKLSDAATFDPRLGGKAASGRFRDPKTGKIVSYTGFMTDDLAGLDSAVRERYGADTKYMAVYHDVAQGVDTTIPVGIDDSGTIVGTEDPSDLSDARPITSVYVMPEEWRPPGASAPASNRVRELSKDIRQTQHLVAQAYATTAKAEILTSEAEALTARSVRAIQRTRLSIDPEPMPGGPSVDTPADEYQPDAAPDAEPDAMDDTQPDAAPDDAPASTLEEAVASEAAAEPEPEPEPQPEPEPEAKPEPKPEPRDGLRDTIARRLERKETNPLVRAAEAEASADMAVQRSEQAVSAARNALADVNRLETHLEQMLEKNDTPEVQEMLAQIQRVKERAQEQQDQALYASREADSVGKEAEENSEQVSKTLDDLGLPTELDKATAAQVKDQAKLPGRQEVNAAGVQLRKDTEEFIEKRHTEVMGVKPDSPKADRGEDLTPSYNPAPEPEHAGKKPPPDPKVAAGEPRPLRPHQLTLENEINENLAESPTVLAVAPTGAGKTAIFSEMTRKRLEKGQKVAVLIDGDELIQQAIETLERQTGEKVGVVQGQRREWDKNITVISHGTVVDEGVVPPESFKPNILFVDEAHHAAAEGWRSIIVKIGAPEMVGFTGTSFREDKMPLTPEPFANVVRPIAPMDLIEQGYLVPPRIENVDLTNADGEQVSIRHANNLPAIYADGVSYAMNKGRKKVVVFIGSSPTLSPIEVVERTTQELRRRGIDAGMVVSSGPSASERTKAVKDFRQLDEGVLVNYGTLTEGFDVPSTDAIILGREAESEGEIIQMIGRALRSDPENPDKRDALILNYTQRDDIPNLVHYWRIDNPDGTTLGSEDAMLQESREKAAAARRRVGGSRKTKGGITEASLNRMEAQLQQMQSREDAPEVQEMLAQIQRLKERSTEPSPDDEQQIGLRVGRKANTPDVEYAGGKKRGLRECGLHPEGRQQSAHAAEVQRR